MKYTGKDNPKGSQSVKTKYIKRSLAGGLGAQIKTLAVLIPFAEKFDLQVISDVRTFPYFRGPRASTYLSDDKLDQLLEFHPRIIYNSEFIDSISPNQFAGGESYKKEAIFDLSDWRTQRQVLDWLLCSSTARGGWERMVNHPKRANKPVKYPYFTQLPIRIKDRALIEKYESRIRNSVAVHARLGNGEAESFEARWAVKKLPNTLKRMKINPDKFIDEMKKYNEDFFVCSDTFSFIEKCKDTFGDRVFYTDRRWTPDGFGPGHKAPGLISQRTAANRWDQWDNFYDAVTEMELLSKSKHLICNKSQFSTFARENGPSTMIRP